MSYTTIQSALDAQLALVATLPTLFTENIRALPRTGTPFSRTTLLPAESVPLSSDTDSLQGLYQIDLFYPVDTGFLTASAMADAVLALFPRGLVLEQNGITVHVRTSWRQPAQPFEQFYNVPVVVRWESLQPKG